MKKLLLLLFPAVFAFLSYGCNAGSVKPDGICAKPFVRLDIKITAKGTKSEGRSSYMSINGIPVPDCFNMVIADGRVYTFITKRYLWGDDGYFQDTDVKMESVYPPAGKRIGDADIESGWSEISERYLNVPEGWVFVKWDGGSAAVSPEKISLLVETKKISRIQRNAMFDRMMMK